MLTPKNMKLSCRKGSTLGPKQADKRRSLDQNSCCNVRHLLWLPAVCGSSSFGRVRVDLLHGSMEAPRCIKGALRSSHTASDTLIDPPPPLHSVIASPGNCSIQFSSPGMQLSRMDDTALMFLMNKYFRDVMKVDAGLLQGRILNVK